MTMHLCCPLASAPAEPERAAAVADAVPSEGWAGIKARAPSEWSALQTILWIDSLGIEYDPKEFANRAINGTDLLVFVQLSRLAELGISQSARRRVIVPRLQTLALAPASAPQMHAASGGRV